MVVVRMTAATRAELLLVGGSLAIQCTDSLENHNGFCSFGR